MSRTAHSYKDLGSSILSMYQKNCFMWQFVKEFSGFLHCCLFYRLSSNVDITLATALLVHSSNNSLGEVCS